MEMAEAAAEVEEVVRPPGGGPARCPDRSPAGRTGPDRGRLAVWPPAAGAGGAGSPASGSSGHPLRSGPKPNHEVGLPGLPSRRPGLGCERCWAVCTPEQPPVIGSQAASFFACLRAKEDNTKKSADCFHSEPVGVQQVRFRCVGFATRFQASCAGARRRKMSTTREEERRS